MASSKQADTNSPVPITDLGRVSSNRHFCTARSPYLANEQNVYDGNQHSALVERVARFVRLFALIPENSLTDTKASECNRRGGSCCGGIRRCSDAG